MSTSYVLIGCELGCELAIMDEIRTVRGVEDVCGIYGCYVRHYCQSNR